MQVDDIVKVCLGDVVWQESWTRRPASEVVTLFQNILVKDKVQGMEVIK